MTETIKDARSGISAESLQETIDAAVSATHATLGNLQQYQTPTDFASAMNSLLPGTPDSVFDPQCAAGQAFTNIDSYHTKLFGFEIDRRYLQVKDRVKRVIGNCVTAYDIMDDLFPELTFKCQVSNPPFGIRLKLASGMTADSTEYTWFKVMEKASPTGHGWLLSNWKTIERLKIHEHPRVYLYQKFPAGLWKGTEVEIGVVHWDACGKRPLRRTLNYHTLDLTEHGDALEAVRKYYLDEDINRGEGTDSYDIAAAFETIQAVLNEERAKRPDFNIYLDKHGMLRTYLSTRTTVKRKLTREEIARLARVDHQHCLTLTVDRESRKLMASLIACGFYTIQPEALAAMAAALLEVGKLSAPIMPITSFESVAHADEEDRLVCAHDFYHNDGLCFTAGKSYELSTDSYEFTEKFVRKKPHYSEEENKMHTIDHHSELKGTDRFIRVFDDNSMMHRFMDRPQDNNKSDHEEATLWTIFQKPAVKTVGETHPEVVAKNKLTLATCELLADFSFMPGQMDYLARLAVKDYGIVAGETGSGKTLFAISLIQVKGPKRALILAPQGTVRKSAQISGGDEDDDEPEASEYQASQWIEELGRFARGLPVFQLFNMEDCQRVKDANGGLLPGGVFISYYDAFLKNGAREKAASNWNDERLEKEIQTIMGDPSLELPEAPGDSTDPEHHWCNSVGKEKDGIRCILQPSMATLIGDQFDMVCLDEGHLAANLSSNLCQTVIRLNAKYRWIFSATPIPNVITNLFPLMGWVAVPEWHKGDRRNAAWPFAREELARFRDNFMSTERDFTQEDINDENAKKAGTKYKGRCEKDSPIISSPARLLKLVKPSLAFISKRMCNPGYEEPKVVDVRVPLGTQQMKLYGHFLNRGNVPGKHVLEKARKQSIFLRNICADPAGFEHGGPKVDSNFNPKTLAILELTRDVVKKGDPIIIVCARKGQNNTLHTLLRDAGVLVSRIDSTVPAEQHSYQSHLFKTHQTQVHLMGIKSAVAHGYNECPYEIIASLEWTCGSLQQAKGRFDRVLSKYPRTLWCILNKNTIEDTMFDTVATKDDAATIVLRGERVPRNFKPVDSSEVLAMAITNFTNESVGETQCESQWPALRAAFK